MPASKYTDVQKAEALRLVEEVGQSETSRRMGIPKGTICTWAKRAGVKSHAANIAREAHEHNAARNALRRQTLAAKLLDDAERLSDLIWKPCVVYSFGGKNNTFAESTASEPDPKAKRELMAAAKDAAKTSAELEAVDRDDSAERTALLEWVEAMRGGK